MNVRVANVLAIGPAMTQPPIRQRRGRQALPVDEATPGGRLRALREGRAEGQHDLAEVLGVDRPIVSKYEGNKHAMPDYIIERAAQHFGVTPAFIRYGDTSSRMAEIVGVVGAGARIVAEHLEQKRYVEVPASWTDAIALDIEGLSCYPIYDDGDYLVIRGDRRLDEGEILGRMCVVETSDGIGLVKRVRRGSLPGLFNLESPNAPTLEDISVVSARPVRLHGTRG
jgi:transcriptional regulator with XRE-family HTH domain